MNELEQFFKTGVRPEAMQKAIDNPTILEDKAITCTQCTATNVYGAEMINMSSVNGYIDIFKCPDCGHVMYECIIDNRYEDQQ